MKTYDKNDVKNKTYVFYTYFFKKIERKVVFILLSMRC